MNRVEEITPEKMREINEKLERMAVENPIFNWKNRFNVYTCERCGNPVVTKYLHVGTTPYTMGCDDPDCSGQAVSSGYPRNLLNAKSLPHDYEWFRPLTEEECSEARWECWEYANRAALVDVIPEDVDEIRQAIANDMAEHLLRWGLKRRQTAHGKERVQQMKGRGNAAEMRER